MSFEVFVTGFGPFAHVKVNPSSTVAKEVRDQLEMPGVHTHFAELETSVRFTKAYFDSLEKHLDEALGKDPQMRVLLCHFGVHSFERGGVMRLEVEAFNELFAHVPDVDGVVFNHDLIRASDEMVSRHSWFGEGVRHERLQRLFQDRNAMAMENASSSVDKDRMPPQWVISHDAGRYLCNYCLYLSLVLQEKYKERVASVFIHVCDSTLQADSKNDKSAWNPSLETQTAECVAVVRTLVQLLAE